jgi:exodeoxyribonuclease V alpha subunit
MNDRRYEIIDNKLKELSKSKFRSSFHLRKYMISYIEEKGIDIIKTHAYDFINTRLKPSYIENDGKQTPMKGHPVFIAQHACGCCCRSCLEKWHHIPKGRELTTNEVNYIVSLLIEWIRRELDNLG